jgi:protein-disulfide isomerase
LFARRRRAIYAAPMIMRYLLHAMPGRAGLLGIALSTMPLGASAQAGIDLTGVGYDRGLPTAPVTVIEFGDFGCSACGQFARETMPLILSEYINRGIVRWKYVPFVLGPFPNGREATRGGECAAEQSSFWRWHDTMFARQKEWGLLRNPKQRFLEYAKELGLDPVKFAACYDGTVGRDRTERNGEVADAFMVRGTPTFFVNGGRVVGALPIEQFRKVVADALARVKR